MRIGQWCMKSTRGGFCWDTNGTFTLTETETETETHWHRSLYLSRSVWTPPYNPIQPFLSVSVSASIISPKGNVYGWQHRLLYFSEMKYSFDWVYSIFKVLTSAGSISHIVWKYSTWLVLFYCLEVLTSTGSVPLLRLHMVWKYSPRLGLFHCWGST